MPAGRPTDYKPEYCEDIINYLSDGKHIIQYAAKIGVAKSTIYEWANNYPEFSDALKKAQAKSTAQWLENARLKAFSGEHKGSDAMLIWMLKKKDKEEFGDKDVDDKKSDSVSILGAVSSETLRMIAKDLMREEK